MLLGLLTLCGINGMAANKKTTVAQVTTTVSLTDDVDYVVSSATPFGDDGVVNIVNTDHAVLILSGVKPSKAISLLAKHVQINGAKAANNTNCQVKLYNRGCIILPYGNATKPLTVYSEPNFAGESCNEFGLENSGGFMNTLTEAKLNNKIRSFKLKRGYMVTFSLLPSGRGYSRCFIAADKDLEISSLPVVMDKKISSYRVFKWYDTGKQGVANDTRSETVEALNVTSCYSFGLGEDRAPNSECVPHHIYEDWPSAAACGGVTYSPHMKTNNEPGNSADDHPQTVKQILDNWENLMRTGMRLCSPSSHDGSLAHLREFMDSIDARGWRCDIIDLHCYWPEWNFSNSIKTWVDTYHRPIWISEWVWGASWNNNGIFSVASGDNRDNPTQAQLDENKTVVERICKALNGFDYIERYYYWNSEANCSKLYYNGALTPAGEMYAQLNSGVGYNGKYDYVPNTPKQYAPSQFVTSTTDDGKVQLQWYDPNGEFNQLMEVQKKGASGTWTTHEVIAQKEQPSTYTYTIDAPEEGTVYRVHVIDMNGKEYYSSEDLAVGDQMEVGGKVLYVGGNILRNGDFNLGFLGWTNGKDAPLAEPLFQVVKKGGIGGGAYLQAYSTGAADAEGSLKKLIELQPNTNYYFRAGVLNGNPNMRISLTSNGTTESKVVGNMKTTSAWTRVGYTFNSSAYTKALLSFRQLGYYAQMDKMELYRLFETQEEAFADGLAAANAEAQLAMTYNTKYEAFNTELANVVSNHQTATFESINGIETAIANQLRAIQYMAVVDSLNEVLSHTSASECYQYGQMRTLLAEAATATSTETVINNVNEVKRLLAAYFDFSDANVQPKSPRFQTVDDWKTKIGTYTDGDQRKNTAGGLSCWNAWWSLPAASNPTATMEISQEVAIANEGIYTLECKATTEHFCTTDQHAYIKLGDKTVVSPNLTSDFFDLKVDNIWETLTTAPIYLHAGDTITIGFVGSKQGAEDGKWHRVGSSAAGDNREGWWCATDFVLKYHPITTLTTTPNQWGVTCQPYVIAPSEGVKFYQIVGFNPEYTQLCLEEIETSPAGMPCIYRSEHATTPLIEWGQAVKSTTDAPGNIKGFFSTTSRIPVNYFYVEDGIWKKQTIASGNDRPNVPNYSGIMLPFTNKNWTYIPVIEDWNGAVMPIEGVTDAEKAANTAGIVLPTVTKMSEGYYTIDGRRLMTVPAQGGLFIKVENGQARKVVVR